MKKTLLSWLLTGLSMAGYAQTKTLAGKLVYANGKPASGWLVTACEDADLSDKDGSFLLHLSCTGSRSLIVQRATGSARFLVLDSVRVLAGGTVVMPPLDSLKPAHWIATAKSYKPFIAPPPIAVKKPVVGITKPSVIRKGKTSLSDVTITRYKKPLIEPDRPASRSVLTAKEVEKMPMRDVSSSVNSYAGVSSSVRAKATSVAGGRSTADGYTVTEAMPEFKGEGTSTLTPSSSTPTEATAGKLTSGEVNDFSKWELWTGTSGKELLGYSKSWNLRFTDRYTVRVKSADGAPQANVPVMLKASGSGKIVWQARTDNTGTAELWRGTSWEASDLITGGKVDAEAQVNGAPFTLQNITTGAGGNILEVRGQCNPVRKLDISFIVDATSSMSDEIKYLKAEIEDILKKTADSLQKTDIRTAAVFYRDLEDDYVVKSSPFTAGVTETQHYIAAQSAAGGGDGPEAVDLALDEALNALEWRDDALRIAFLVLDAPPHNTPAIQQRLASLGRQYAAKGIRLVPVVCSGAEKSTETLLRNLALATNGTYVFLTDHSGVGDSHMSPTTDKYDVTYLNGLLYRIIYQFAFMPECAPQASGQTSQVQQSLPGEGGTPAALVWSYFPNPTTGVLNVRYEATKGQLYITDVSGRALLRETVTGNGTTLFDLSNYPSGIYFLRFEYGADQFVTGRFVVSH